MTNEVLKRRPFHKSVLDAICFASMSDMSCLARLIKATQIPKGHDEIFEAWKEHALELGLDDDLGVTADLLAQKEEAEWEATRPRLS